MTIGSLNPILVPGSPGTLTQTVQPADPAAVRQFETAMAPQASAPARPLATDSELAQFSEREMAQLRRQWGDDDAGLRGDAKMRLEIRDKAIESAILKFVMEHCSFKVE